MSLNDDGTITMTESKRKKIINGLIEKSFGSSFRGDYSIKRKTAAEEGIGNVIVRGNSLNIIVSENSMLQRILTLDSIGKYKGYAGVLNEDGSEITVLPEFPEQAKKYVELYLKKAQEFAEFPWVFSKLKEKAVSRVASMEEISEMVYTS